MYDLALVVVDECSKVFFDQTKALDQRPEVVDLFSSAISKIVSFHVLNERCVYLVVINTNHVILGRE